MDVKKINKKVYEPLRRLGKLAGCPASGQLILMGKSGLHNSPVLGRVTINQAANGGSG
ncbi:hypothetical protein [Allobaculum sp. JKK-2023]|uniref:hypothetical protein n=1 Tax=Allobaculum sp. JKK-2023 TaxID=3108943 RepID=UPI002B057F13|nr:hypothetical protein [Allobaculum sp. JKK-2023]